MVWFSYQPCFTNLCTSCEYVIVLSTIRAPGVAGRVVGRLSEQWASATVGSLVVASF